MSRDLFGLEFLYKDFPSQLSTFSDFFAVFLCKHSAKFDLLLLSPAESPVP